MVEANQWDDDLERNEKLPMQKFSDISGIVELTTNITATAQVGLE